MLLLIVTQTLKLSDKILDSLCASNQILSTSECVKVKKFKCKAEGWKVLSKNRYEFLAGTGTAVSENVCGIGQCYCPGFKRKTYSKQAGFRWILGE